MKRKTIVSNSLTCLVLVLFLNKSFSQTNIINATLVSPDSSVLYIGIINTIEITNTKNPFFEIRAAKSKLSSTPHPYRFEIRPYGLWTDTVFIFDGNDVSLKKAFTIVPIPPVEARLGTLRGDEATAEEISINGWLVLSIPNCKCTTSYVVSSFEVEFESETIDEEPIKMEGDRVNVKAKKIIRTLKAGDTVYFDHIKAKNEDGQVIDIPGFSISVQ
jgi:hypothetical protein